MKTVQPDMTLELSHKEHSDLTFKLLKANDYFSALLDLSNTNSESTAEWRTYLVLEVDQDRQIVKAVEAGNQQADEVELKRSQLSYIRFRDQSDVALHSSNLPSIPTHR